MTTDTDMLEANIKNLERENRELRMTLRDQFAMAALTGIVSADSDYQLSLDEVSAMAYDYATSMMEVREK